jgi:hypothetical protein
VFASSIIEHNISPIIKLELDQTCLISQNIQSIMHVDLSGISA